MPMGKMSCENEGEEWADAPTGQGRPKTAYKPQSQERIEQVSPHRWKFSCLLIL